MHVHSTADITNHHIKALIYGPSGSGKTTFAGSMQRKVKTLGLSAESGLLSLQNIRDDKGALIPIEYIKIEKFEDMEAVYAELHHGKFKHYEGVFIDSLTEIQKTCKDFILAKTKKEDMEMRDWGTLAMKIERMVRAFRDLPKHLVVTAAEDMKADKLTGEVRALPDLQGSVQTQLPYYFDEVFYAYSKEVGEGDERRIRHHILTRNSGKYLGKDRSGRLPPVIIDPDFGKVFDLILAKKEGK